MTVSIYALCDPADSKSVRYVGATRDTTRRLEQHIAEARRGRSAKSAWVRALLRAGRAPSLVVLQEEVTQQDAATVEMEWIERLRMQGCALTNNRPADDLPETDFERKADVIRRLVADNLAHGQKQGLARRAGVHPNHLSSQLSGTWAMPLPVLLAALEIVPEIIRESILCLVDESHVFDPRGSE